MNRARFITGACDVSFILLGIYGTLLGPTFQELTRRFGVRLEDGGIFTTMQFGGATLAIMVVGRLLDKINARYLLSGGVLLMGVGLLLLGSAQSLPVALLSTLLLGLGFGAIDVSPNVVVAALNPENPGVALNTLNVFFGIGAIAGPQIVNFALQRQSFTLAYNAAAVFALLLVIPFATVSLHVSTGNRSGPRPAIHWLSLIPLAALLFAYVGTEVGFGAWIVTQVSLVINVSTARATVAASAFWAGLTISRLIASYILRRITDQQMLFLSLAILGSGVGLLLAAPLFGGLAEGVTVLSAFMVGFGCGPVFPTMLGVVNTTYPEARGTVTGVMMTIGTAGAVLIPWLQGQVGNGQNGGMIVLLALAVFQLGMAFYIQRQQVKVPALEV